MRTLGIRDMAEQQSLVEMLSVESPGVEIDAFMMHRTPTVSFRRESQKVWIALEDHPRPDGIEGALRLVANMLVCCHDCKSDPDSSCYQAISMTAERLQELLGESGYRKLLENAPIRVGDHRES